MRTTKLFLDASFAIALVSPRDQYHEHATVLLRGIKAQRIPLITTRPVIVEVGNALAKRPLRAKAVALPESYDRDPGIEVTPLSDDLYERGRRMYR
ncbi:MAG: PIN domain-containing protein, partial [Gemmatimonadetes bacterium]|nr:PIN domain-containing protein [Gemmatimonadota bacterium]